MLPRQRYDLCAMDKHKPIRLNNETSVWVASKHCDHRFNFRLTANGCCDCRTPTDRAAASNEGRKYDPPPGAVSGLNMMATRITRAQSP